MKTFASLVKKITFPLILLFPLAVFAGDWNTDKQGVVLDGYDVVAYQTDDSAVKGSARYSLKYDGVTFFFVSKEHKKMFAKDPQKYIPKYNGYCAFAMGAKNAKVPANADTFKMYNGELLVFFNDLYEGKKFNTKVPWNASEKGFYSKAEDNWTKMK